MNCYIVIGKKGPMAESKRDGPGLWFGERRRGTTPVATEFHDAATARRAIKVTQETRAGTGLKPLEGLYVVRVIGQGE